MAPSDVTEATVEWTAQLGDFDVEAHVMAPPGSDDLPGDNDARRPLSVKDSADLEVISLALSNSRVKVGETITVSVVIENFGNTTVEFSLELMELTDDDVSMTQYNESSVGADISVTQMFQWTAVEGVRGLQVRVEPLGQLERTPEDNEATVDVTVVTADEGGDDDDGVEVPGFSGWAVISAIWALAILCATGGKGRVRHRR